MDLESITGRMKVRTLLQDGNVPAAIDEVNHLNSEVRRSHPCSALLEGRGGGKSLSSIRTYLDTWSRH